MSGMNNRDPFEVLGVSHGASDEEVKNAYRALARKYHPDNYDADNPLSELAEEKMQEINAAYDEIQRLRAENKNNGYQGGGTYYQSSQQSGVNGGENIPPLYKDIRNDIIYTLKRGATVVESHGMYTEEKSAMIISVINIRQIPELYEILRKYPDTFAYYGDVGGVRGNFRWKRTDEVK